MISIKINDLVKIMEARLSTVLFDSFLDILHPDDGKPQYEKFEHILRNSLTQHKIHFANNMVSQIQLANNDEFIFTNNFDAYLLDPLNFGEDNIVLVPDYIIQINYSRINARLPISKKYYDYKKPRLISTINSLVWVNYAASYPLYIDYGPDGKFTDDSILYYIDSESQQFLTRLEYELLMYMKNMEDQIEVPELAIKILANLDNQIKRVEDDLNTWIRTSSSVISFWSC